MWVLLELIYNSMFGNYKKTKERKQDYMNKILTIFMHVHKILNENHTKGVIEVRSCT